MVLRSLSRLASRADEAVHTSRLLVAGFGENRRPRTIGTADRVRENQCGYLRCGRQPSTTAAVFERWHGVGVLPDWIGIEVKLMYDVVVPLGSVRLNTRVASVRAAWR
jgi:hypothetical protein